MKPLRGRAMIASAMSRVRPAGRRTAGAEEVRVESTVPSAPSSADGARNGAPNAPYSLIGW
ncbi:hypothetical protein EV652_105330 [Kribbella steppae]|uniref:Uncharacterized protein n=1 Tax=Kribbella steppae TaxID=2512223 RepID=A0A4V2S060_9ACTN|nr:hypothetical protein [Kribbella steppae]TCO30336.1 hypothetical protein EV652_105330 [Kribbella steppae]